MTEINKISELQPRVFEHDGEQIDVIHIDDVIRRILNRVRNYNIDEVKNNRNGSFQFQNDTHETGTITLKMNNLADEVIVGKLLIDDIVNIGLGTFGEIPNFRMSSFYDQIKITYLDKIRFITTSRTPKYRGYAETVVNPISNRKIQTTGKRYRELFGKMRLRKVIAKNMSKYDTKDYDLLNGFECVPSYMRQYYDKKFIAREDDIYTVEDILKYAEQYNFPCIARDAFYNVITSHKATKTRTQKPKLEFIAHNEHLYVINKKFEDLKTTNKILMKNQTIEDIEQYTGKTFITQNKKQFDALFEEVRKNNIMIDYSPRHFYYRNNKIMFKENYDKDIEVIEKFDYNSDNVYNCLENKVFKLKGFMSETLFNFFKSHQNIKLFVNTSIKEKKEQTLIIDNKKAYPSILYAGLEIPVPDISDEFTEYDDEAIINYGWYVCELNNYDYIFDKDGLYCGHIIKKLQSQNRIKRITHQLVTKKVAFLPSIHKMGDIDSDILRKFVGWLMSGNIITSSRIDTTNDTEIEAFKDKYKDLLKILDDGVQLEYEYFRTSTGLMANYFIREIVNLRLYEMNEQIEKLNPDIILNRVYTDSLGYLYHKDVILPNTIIQETEIKQQTWGLFKIEQKGRTYEKQQLKTIKMRPIHKNITTETTYKRTENFRKQKQLQKITTTTKSNNDYPIPTIKQQNYKILTDTNISKLLYDNKSFLLCGKAGTGKTYLTTEKIIKILKMFKKNYILTSSTILNASDFEEKTNETVTTIQRQIRKLSINELKNNFKNINYLIIDEASQLTQDLLKLLEQIKLNINISIILIGDENQCKAIDATNTTWLKTDFVKQLCDSNIVRLTKIQRYDNELAEALNYVIDEKNTLKQIIDYVKTTFKTSKKIDDKINISYFINTPKATEKKKQLEKEEKTIESVHSMQGKTITEKYTIHDVEYMTREIIYTALTRATKKDNITILI